MKSKQGFIKFPLSDFFENCLVQDKVTQKIINKVALLLGSTPPIYDERKRRYAPDGYDS